MLEPRGTEIAGERRFLRPCRLAAAYPAGRELLQLAEGHRDGVVVGLPQTLIAERDGEK